MVLMRLPLISTGRRVAPPFACTRAGAASSRLQPVNITPAMAAVSLMKFLRVVIDLSFGEMQHVGLMTTVGLCLCEVHYCIPDRGLRIDEQGGAGTDSYLRTPSVACAATPRDARTPVNRRAVAAEEGAVGEDCLSSRHVLYGESEFHSRLPRRAAQGHHEVAVSRACG